MRYVLSTAPNVCSYTTLAKTNSQISMCLTHSTAFTIYISTELVTAKTKRVPFLRQCSFFLIFFKTSHFQKKTSSSCHSMELVVIFGIHVPAVGIAILPAILALTYSQTQTTPLLLQWTPASAALWKDGFKCYVSLKAYFTSMTAQLQNSDRSRADERSFLCVKSINFAFVGLTESVIFTPTSQSQQHCLHNTADCS